MPADGSARAAARDRHRCAEKLVRLVARQQAAGGRAPRTASSIASAADGEEVKELLASKYGIDRPAGMVARRLAIGVQHVGRDADRRHLHLAVRAAASRRR